jgi:hypothetical protein
METPESAAAMAVANAPGRSSAEVQSTLGGHAKSLGFESEKTGLFADSQFVLRPDYYMKLGATGILLEVERGKTTINNMDLLDFGSVIFAVTRTTYSCWCPRSCVRMKRCRRVASSQR